MFGIPPRVSCAGVINSVMSTEIHPRPPMYHRNHHARGYYIHPRHVVVKSNGLLSPSNDSDYSKRFAIGQGDQQVQLSQVRLLVYQRY